MTITFSEARAMMRTARRGCRKLQNNTYLYPGAGNLSGEPDEYYVRLHSTNVVTIHRDGTYTLNTDGWETVTTKDRINGYGPARVYSERGTWAVWHKSDPSTPPKMQKCRACHGTGTQHTQAWTETHGPLVAPAYEVTTDHAWNTVHEGLTYPDIYYSEYRDMQPLVRDGVPLTAQPKMIYLAGQVRRHNTGEHWRLPVPVFHPAEPYTCYSCGGTGQRDYGSKSMPVIFYDGIRVDGDGQVVSGDRDRLNDPERAARQKAEAAAARKAMREAETARLAASRPATNPGWLTGHGLEVRDGEVTMFKAVQDDLRSYHGTAYIPGTTVEAEDYNAGNLGCGQGLHFSPTPRMAASYDREATRYLACAVDLETMIIIGDGYGAPKVKARSCRVLYEVDIDGNPLTEATNPEPESRPGPDAYTETF